MVLGSYFTNDPGQQLGIYLCDGEGGNLQKIASGFEPSWTTGSKGSSTNTGSKNQASCYGFKYGSGWRVDTRRSAYDVASIVDRDRFNTEYYENGRPDDAKQRMKNDSVFFFDGHGNTGGIWFEEKNGNETFVNGSYIRDVGDMSKMKVAVYLSCLTGENPDDPDSIIRVGIENGAGATIGFSHLTTSGDSPWATKFFAYLLKDHLSVQDAAMKAAYEVNNHGFDPINSAKFGRILWSCINPDCTVVRGRKRWESVKPE